VIILGCLAVLYATIASFFYFWLWLATNVGHYAQPNPLLYMFAGMLALSFIAVGTFVTFGESWNSRFELMAEMDKIAMETAKNQKRKGLA
jgi:hypothetical protein